jgi:hypothetical protein
MSQDQFLGILRAILPAVLAYVVGRGWIDAGSVGDISAAVVAVASALWSTWAHNKSNTIAAAAVLPEVKKVEMEPTEAGIALHAKVGSTPSAVVTVADPPPTSPKDK